MALRIIKIFIATAAVAYAAMSATFWGLCKIVEHHALERLTFVHGHDHITKTPIFTSKVIWITRASSHRFQVTAERGTRPGLQLSIFAYRSSPRGISSRQLSWSSLERVL